MTRIPSTLVLIIAAIGLSCSPGDPKTRADAFLHAFTTTYQKLYYAYSEAQWVANTDISRAHDSISTVEEQKYSAFVGSTDVIGTVRQLLAGRDALDPMQIMQLEKIRLLAAHRPGTIPETVDSLISATTHETSLLYGYDIRLPQRDGTTRVVSTNDIDKILLESTNVQDRLAAWSASKDLGTTLKDGLAELQYLRNRVAREMGFSSFFDLEVADYGMTTPEMMALMDTLDSGLRPLYRELHTYARYELARRYHQPVPDMLPAHWLPNRWGQNWPGMVTAVDLDALFKGRTREWVVQQAESFYVSLGFPALRQNFWERSDLYPAEPGSGRKKNNHASAWHMDLQDDYRSLMSVEPNADWFGTAHHELGHIYYYITYSTPDVPLLLREGANRSYHEGIGDLMDLASSQRSYLRQLGLLPAGMTVDTLQWLLNDALSSSSVVFIPFAAGVMSHFEHDLYENDLPREEFNTRWWAYVRRFQGIVPPSTRGDDYCDAATKTHIIDDPAQYYDYALSCVLKFHLHDYIARRILHQDPRNCNYYGNREVGDFLRSIMAPGASRDWRSVLKEKTGEDLSARAMLDYYRPLLEYLKQQNRGRVTTLD